MLWDRLCWALLSHGCIGEKLLIVFSKKGAKATEKFQEVKAYSFVPTAIVLLGDLARSVVLTDGDEC